MHLYFGLRGVKHMSDLFETHAQSQYFLWERENMNVCSCNHPKHDGKCKSCECNSFSRRKETFNLQGSLRPVQLYEYVFPEECLEEVLTMFQMSDEVMDYHENSLGKIGKFFLDKFRKILGLKPIPRGIPRKEPKHIIPLHGVTLHPIGIKTDIKKEMPEFGYYQEMI